MEIRKLRIDDAEEALFFLKKLVAESPDTILLSTVTLTVEEEEQFIESFVDKNLMIGCFDNNKIVGILTLNNNKKIQKISHNYSVGVSVLKDYYNQGLATKMFQVMDEHIEKYQLQNVFLEVVDDNSYALKLYTNFHFRKVGVRENFFKTESEYKNIIIMRREKYSKIDSYEEVIKIVPTLIKGIHPLAIYANLSKLLSDYIKDINWIGFYLNMDNALILGPFVGEIACQRIDYDKGVCGKCFTDKKTIIVDDVHSFSGHIACDSRSNSEIVLPIIYNDQVQALLDIDSPYFSRFDEVDQKYLEIIVSLIEKELNTN